VSKLEGEFMKSFIYITIFAFTLFTGMCSTGFVERVNIRKKKIDDFVIRFEAEKIKFPRFKLISGESVQSSVDEKRFADDCIGCNEGIGEINIYHNFQSPEQIRYSLEANCGKENVIERSFKLNEDGQKIGERCVIVFTGSGARIFWTEGETEYWIIDATSLGLTKEFEKSETFRLVKSGRYFN
jgi:hypothetical protein